jgi:uncharacterized OB-fold protein
MSSSTSGVNICPSCGKTWDERFNFCPMCGTNMRKMRFLERDESGNYIDVLTATENDWEKLNYYPDCDYLELKLDEMTQKLKSYCTKNDEWVYFRKKMCWRCFTEGKNEL